MRHYEYRETGEPVRTEPKVKLRDPLEKALWTPATEMMFHVANVAAVLALTMAAIGLVVMFL